MNNAVPNSVTIQQTSTCRLTELRGIKMAYSRRNHHLHAILFLIMQMRESLMKMKKKHSAKRNCFAHNYLSY